MTGNLHLTKIVLISYIAATAGLYRQMSARRVASYDNKKMAQSVLWTLKNMSKLECLGQCYMEEDCVTIQYTSTQSTCVALNDKFDGKTVWADENAGYQMYETDKGTDCLL